MDLKRASVFFLLVFLMLYASVVSDSFAAGAQPADVGISVSGDDGSVEPSQFDEFDEFKEEAVTPVADPLIGYNRFMTRVNDRLYFWVLKPVARGYGAIVKEPARIALGRFYDNAAFPIRLVNNLLQLKVKHAGIETARFGINSTIGIAGLFDPAKSWWHLQAYPEDFGQTLGYYGVGSGFHIVLPLLGPSNLRDLCGMFPDLLLHPVMYFRANNIDRISWAVAAHDRINRISLHIGDYECLRKSAVDLYIFLRNAYEQNRKKQIEE